MKNPILQYFEFGHLPKHLQSISSRIHNLVISLDEELPDGAEKSAGMRKLLEAKDCFVRANIPPPELTSTVIKTQIKRESASDTLGNLTQSEHDLGLPIFMYAKSWKHPSTDDKGDLLWYRGRSKFLSLMRALDGDSWWIAFGETNGVTCHTTHLDPFAFRLTGDEDKPVAVYDILKFAHDHYPETYKAYLKNLGYTESTPLGSYPDDSALNPTLSQHFLSLHPNMGEPLVAKSDTWVIDHKISNLNRLEFADTELFNHLVRRYSNQNWHFGFPNYAQISAIPVESRPDNFMLRDRLGMAVSPGAIAHIMYYYDKDVFKDFLKDFSEDRIKQAGIGNIVESKGTAITEVNPSLDEVKLPTLICAKNWDTDAVSESGTIMWYGCRYAFLALLRTVPSEDGVSSDMDLRYLQVLSNLSDPNYFRIVTSIEGNKVVPGQILKLIKKKYPESFEIFSKKYPNLVSK